MRGRRLPPEVTGETFQQFLLPRPPLSPVSSSRLCPLGGEVCGWRWNSAEAALREGRRDRRLRRRRRARCELVVYEFIAAASSSRWQRQPSYARSSLFRLTAEIFRIEIFPGERNRVRCNVAPLRRCTHTRIRVSRVKNVLRRTRSPAHLPLTSLAPTCFPLRSERYFSHENQIFCAFEKKKKRKRRSKEAKE